MAFKLINNKEDMAAWRHVTLTADQNNGIEKKVEMVVQKNDNYGRLFFILENGGRGVNMEISDGLIRFHSGGPNDLARALLALTAEHEAGTLASEATEAFF